MDGSFVLGISCSRKPPRSAVASGYHLQQWLTKPWRHRPLDDGAGGGVVVALVAAQEMASRGFLGSHTNLMCSLRLHAWDGRGGMDDSSSPAAKVD